MLNDEGKVVGLIELVNKEIREEVEAGEGGGALQRELERRNSAYGFSSDEARLLRMLCAHCSIFLKHLEVT